MKNRSYSLLYALLWPIVYVAARIFYRRWRVFGRSRFPAKGTPVIVVSNHQNALIDPLLCCLSAPRQMHFLTRADVFRNPLLRPFVLALNMLPVYRVRDMEEGKNERNMLTFKTAIARMTRGAAVGIFPEGNHGNQKIIRPLKKGLAQLLEISAEESDAMRRLQIIPLGVDYSDYDHARASVVMYYGEPFTVDDLLFTDEDRLVRYRAVMQRVHEKMAEVTLDLGPQAHYAILRMAEAMVLEQRGFGQWPDAHRRLSSLKSQLAASYATSDPLWMDGELVVNALQKAGVPLNAMVRKPKPGEGLRLVLLGILALPGFVLHVPAWQLALAATRKIVVDEHFNSTFRLLFGMLLFGLTWAVGIAAVFFLTEWTVQVQGCVLFSFLASSILALPWSDQLMEYAAAKKAARFKSQNPEYAALWARLEAKLNSHLSQA